MNSFESWMQQQGLSESPVKKYGSAVSGPLTAWANANSIVSDSLTDIEDLSKFESISLEVRRLPIFVERNSTGHGMYNAVLVKFAKYLTLYKPSATSGSSVVKLLPLVPYPTMYGTTRLVVC